MFKLSNYKNWLILVWFGFCFYMLGALVLGWKNPEVHEGFVIGMATFSAPISFAFIWLSNLIGSKFISKTSFEIMLWLFCTVIGFLQWCVILPWIVEKILNSNKKSKI